MRYEVVPYYNMSFKDLEKELNKEFDRYVVSMTPIVYENAKSYNVGHLDWVVLFKV
jgi:uncharacterized protein (DUF885 family)